MTSQQAIATAALVVSCAKVCDRPFASSPTTVGLFYKVKATVALSSAMLLFPLINLVLARLVHVVVRGAVVVPIQPSGAMV